jgi:hypothetical protein
MGDDATVGFDQFCHDLEKRTLSRAVRPDQRNPVSLANLETRVLKDLIAAMRVPNPRCLNQECHVTDPSYGHRPSIPNRAKIPSS